MAIPLPTLLRGWRDRSWREGLEPATMRRASASGRSSPAGRDSIGWRARVGVRAMRLFGRRGWISSLPLAGAWTAQRDFPTPPGQTFMAQYRREAGRDRQSGKGS